ncbi:MAG: hypothetical protein AAGA01_15755, partial [Cyanobacteria bacterium P01_E01_bin.43]
CCHWRHYLLELLVPPFMKCEKSLSDKPHPSYFQSHLSDLILCNFADTGEQSRQETKFVAWFQKIEVTLSL